MGVKVGFLSLSAEYRLRVPENRRLRETFECKRDEVAGKWRILRYENLCCLRSS